MSRLRSFSIASILAGILATAAVAQPPNPVPAPPLMPSAGPGVSMPVFGNDPGVVTTWPYPGDEGPVPAIIDPNRRRWFVDIDTGILVPHIKNELSAPVTVDGDTDTLFIGQPELDTADALRIRLGYQRPDGFGGFALGYRYIVSEGFAHARDRSRTPSKLDVLSRLDLNVADLSYVSPAFAFAPQWVMNWEVGGRLGSIFFDNEALLPVNQPQLIDLHVSNHFFGAGPQAAFGVSRALGTGRFALFGKADGSILIGRVTQRYRVATAFGTPESGETVQRGSQAVPTLAIQAGLCWTPWASGRFQLLTGYQFEQFWNVGDIADSRADLWAQGAFLTFRFNY